MKRKVYILFILTVSVFSCKTIDVEKEEGLNLSEENKQLREELENTKQELSYYVKNSEYEYDIEPAVIQSTNFVVIDKNELKENEKKEVTGKEAVKSSMKESIVPLKEYTGGMSIFDYNGDYQFPVFTKKLSMSTIILNNDEVMTTDDVFLSDSKSWEITGDVWPSPEGSRQLIMIKPLESGLETDMLVVTDKRLYKFILYSTKADYQPMVRFRYPTERKFITGKTKKSNPMNLVTLYGDTDPDLISVNYKIRVPVLQKKVDWVPELVYDDGSFTYIRLPEVVLQKEFPVFYEKGDNIVNYEIHPKQHNLVVINKLIEKVTLRVGKQKVTVMKKKGDPSTISVKR